MKNIQRLGKSLLLPVSVMPIAALLKGLGYWIDPTGWGANSVIAAFLIESGSIIIDNLPLFFAIGVANGMSPKKDVMLTFCAVLSYLIISKLLSPEMIALLKGIDISKVPLAYYSSSNAFIGIITGLIVAFNFKYFAKVKLPAAISFFGGKRFVPVLSTVMMLFLGFVLIVVWPILYGWFVNFGKSIANLGPIGAGIYGFFNRLLVSTGLHHALNSVFWFDVAGINDVGKFWGTVSGGIKGVTGMYQAGFFPVMMFGLPAAGIAIYQCAKDENKKQVGAVMLSAAFASFVTGVTEPLEFAFMFVAPILYFIHAILTGIMMYIAATFHFMAGFGFSAGLIDYVLSIKSPFANNIIMLIPLGLICGIIYYCIFKFAIIRYDLMTPGRDDEEDEINVVEEERTSLISNDYDELAITLIEALGGRHNIITVECCITRLRIELNDLELIDEQGILATGAAGLIKIGKSNIQVVIGTEVEFIVEAMNEILI